MYTAKTKQANKQINNYTHTSVHKLMRATYLCLNHVASKVPHVQNESEDVQLILDVMFVNEVHDVVYANEGACASHPGTARRCLTCLRTWRVSLKSWHSLCHSCNVRVLNTAHTPKAGPRSTMQNKGVDESTQKQEDSSIVLLIIVI